MNKENAYPRALAALSASTVRYGIFFDILFS
jgi:hypothetical protein